MKHRLLLAALCALTTVFACRAGYNDDAWAYIYMYQNAALQTEYKYGVPASITLAQGILESGCGKSLLTRRSNNHFGIKGVGPAGSAKAKDDEPGLSTFKAYHNAMESYEDHARLLSRNSPLYGKLHNYSRWDYRSWAYGIKACGYATAPDYAKSLIGIIERFQLYKINNGRKLQGGSGRRVVVRRIIRRTTIVNNDNGLVHTDSVPEFEDEDLVTLNDDQITAEEQRLDHAVENYKLIENGVPCIVLMPGRTLGDVCRDYDISDKKLLFRFNEVKGENQLTEGDIVYLDTKRDKYEGARNSYTARPGDTLHSISQLFGIKVKKLAGLNGLKDTSTRPRPGTLIHLN